MLQIVELVSEGLDDDNNTLLFFLTLAQNEGVSRMMDAAFNSCSESKKLLVKSN